MKFNSFSVMEKDIKRYLAIVSYAVRIEWVRPDSEPTTIFIWG